MNARQDTFAVEEIHKPESLQKLQKDWQETYAVDPHANLYNSFSWIETWINYADSPWVVLAIRENSSNNWVAFLPLSIRFTEVFGIHLLRDAYFMSYPNSVYTGFLCRPEHESYSMELLAEYISRHLKFNRLMLRWVRDPRYKEWLGFFSRKVKVKVTRSMDSLRIKLPDSFDDLLMQNMGRTTRRTIRLRRRNIENNDNFRISVSDEDSVLEDVEFLCENWNKRWQKEKMMQWHAYVLKEYYKRNQLRLTVLKDGEKSVSALACIMDPVHRTVNNYLTIYLQDYSDISPGIVLLSESIENAINQQYTYYDLTLGSDPYKLSFGPEQLPSWNISFRKRSLQNMTMLGTAKGIRKIRNWLS